jgi:hypothetical protein
MRTSRLIKTTTDGTIHCYTNIGDATFAERMDQFGRMSVRIRSWSTPRQWPEGRTVSKSDLGWLVAEFAAQVDFLADRADLCRVLAEKANVSRGPAYAWQTEASYPARLVQALIIARDLGSPELEKTIDERLRLAPLPNSAKDWAKQYSKALGFPAPI